MKIKIRTCLLIASSVLKSSSSPRFLICSSRAVAIFICVSRVAFRAVSSGNCVMAVFKCAAFVERSLETPTNEFLKGHNEGRKGRTTVKYH